MVPPGKHAEPIGSPGVDAEILQERVLTGSGSHLPIYAALVGNLLIAIAKFFAAFVTGSSAMLSEGVHSTVDTTNQLLLLYGIHRAGQPADYDHPLGHGRELYFWAFIVALLVFSLGAGISFYEGITHLMHPEPVSSFTITYVVLGLSAVFEGASLWFAIREFSREKGANSFFKAARRSKDPTTLTVLFEDSAAMIGIGIAFAGVLASQLTGIAEFDGAASIGIGVLLTGTALFLARETKGLLIGERASRELEDSIRDIAGAQQDVERVNDVTTVHLAPDQVVVILSIDFSDDLRTAGLEVAVQEIQKSLKHRHSQILQVSIMPMSATLSSPA